MATLEKILGCGKNIIRNSLLSVAGLGIALFGYGKLYGAQPTQPTYRDLDVKTEQLESGLEATLVSGMWSLWFDDVSIVVDNESNPHIIYKNSDQDLELADVNDGKWRAINLGSGIGGWNSIIMDDEGYFYISSSEHDGSNEDLLYFTDKDGWIEHEVSRGLSVGLENDIALDSNGKVHISHWQWNGSRLLYTTNKNGDWETTILDEDAGWTKTNIAIDNNDNIFISYSCNKLGVLDNLTGEWTQEELPLYRHAPSRMAMDNEDRLHIVGQGGSSEFIYLTDEDEWQPHIIYKWVGGFMNNKWYRDVPSIALDSNGKIHIAIIGGEYHRKSLLYFTNKSGEWKEFLIDRSFGCHNPDIAVDHKGNVHIAYSEDNGISSLWGYYRDRTVKYVKFNPSELFLPYKLITGLCYGPYREGQDPTQGIHPNIDEITEDLLFISKLTPYIRTYGIDETLFDIPDLCYNKGLNCFVGIHLSGDRLANDQTIENALNLARKEEEGLYAIIVGNEAVFRGDLTATEVADYIETLRRRIDEDKPFIWPRPRYITTGDTCNVWLNNPELGDAADIIMANIHPYWDGVSIEDAAAYVVDRYNELDAAYNKQVVISETGWPSDGEVVGNAVPSVENQKRFLLEFTQLAKEHNIPYLYFEAFDEPWKANYEGEAGRHWGLVDVDGNVKPSLKAIIQVMYSSLKGME